MNKTLIKKIDFLLYEGVGSTIAKVAFVAIVPSILKFLIDLLKNKTTRKLDYVDAKMYYSTMDRKVKQELSNKGFYFSDTSNEGRTDIYTHNRNKDLKIQIHHDDQGRIVRVGGLGSGHGISMKAPTLNIG